MNFFVTSFPVLCWLIKKNNKYQKENVLSFMIEFPHVIFKFVIVMAWIQTERHERGRFWTHSNITADKLNTPPKITIFSLARNIPCTPCYAWQWTKKSDNVAIVWDCKKREINIEIFLVLARVWIRFFHEKATSIGKNVFVILLLMDLRSKMKRRKNLEYLSGFGIDRFSKSKLKKSCSRIVMSYHKLHNTPLYDYGPYAITDSNTHIDQLFGFIRSFKTYNGRKVKLTLERTVWNYWGEYSIWEYKDHDFT